jgi:hypothetical protein
MWSITVKRAVREPVEHAHRAERVPAARFDLASSASGVALMDVPERPPTVGIPVALDDDGLFPPSASRP